MGQPDREAAQPEELTTFNARLSVRVKSTIQRAAELRGQTLSEFVLGSAYDRAVETIEQESILKLSVRDSELFAHAISRKPTVHEDVAARFIKAHAKAIR